MSDNFLKNSFVCEGYGYGRAQVTKKYFCRKKRTSLISKNYGLTSAAKHSLAALKLQAAHARTRAARPTQHSCAKIFFCSMLKPHVPALQTREHTHAPENVRGKWRSLNNAGEASTATSHGTGICSYMSKTSVHISS